MQSGENFMWWIRKQQEQEKQISIQQPRLYAPLPEPPPLELKSMHEEEESPRVIIIDL